MTSAHVSFGQEVDASGFARNDYARGTALRAVFRTAIPLTCAVVITADADQIANSKKADLHGLFPDRVNLVN